MDTLKKNQKALPGQSEGFSPDGDTYADADELLWMLEDLPVSADARALDIATGTGEFARAIAPQVASVIGLDATQAITEHGKRVIEQPGIENNIFQKVTEQDYQEWRKMDSEAFDDAFERESDLAAGLRFNAWVEGGM